VVGPASGQRTDCPTSSARGTYLCMYPTGDIGQGWFYVAS